ncbi:MAG: methionine--tRNA ligase [Alphaproteobacteria bacterium]|jgi:methionyl-tRNA synthetase|nr:methionine--tRNA ligase [Alphaproteobacteria bacterium]
MKKRYYITTPIYYVNDNPHIGHAYTTLACDVLARFKRLDDYEVMFLTGTDEHGQKVQIAANKAGVSPQEFTDKVSKNFLYLTEKMNFSNDYFIRTTEPRHYESCQKIWQKLMDNGHITLSAYSGWYSVRDEAFFAESELIDGKAPTGAPVEWVEEPSYFFDLSKWQQPLLDFYEKNPDFVAPASRFNEIKRFVEGGLKDLSISRTTFDWGVPVPGDPEHVMYVWLDALTNYITATNWTEPNSEDFENWWPADLHMVGKDILRFHAVYWPAFLMAAELDLPSRIFAHGWWTNEGEKISKSLGNVIDPITLIDKYGLDQIRYFLMREVPFGRDGDFSQSALLHRINSDLANDLGNLSQRVLSQIFKNLDGKIPSLPINLLDDDASLLAMLKELPDKVRAQIDNQSFHDALRQIWNVIAEANRYVDKQAPWALKKTDTDRMADVLGVLVEVIRCVGLLTQPFMPDASAKILGQIKVNESERTFVHLSDVNLLSGRIIEKPEGVFPRHQIAEEG